MITDKYQIIRVLDQTEADETGTTNVTSSIVDSFGAESVAFVIYAGAIPETGTVAVKVEQSQCS